MRGFAFAAAAWLLGMACSGSDPEGDGGAPVAGSGADTASSAASTSAGAAGTASGATTETLPLTPDEPARVPPASTDAPPMASPYVSFVDAATGFSTDEVHDADREVVRFDSNLEAMVSAASGDSVGGWTVQDADLDWSRSGVAFRVRFGTEDGERRAYFTEAGPGTICNLSVVGPDVLFISATSEMPPNP